LRRQHFTCYNIAFLFMQLEMFNGAHTVPSLLHMLSQLNPVHSLLHRIRFRPQYFCQHSLRSCRHAAQTCFMTGNSNLPDTERPWTGAGHKLPQYIKPDPGSHVLILLSQDHSVILQHHIIHLTRYQHWGTYSTIPVRCP
jgi:hypothetical protein